MSDDCRLQTEEDPFAVLFLPPCFDLPLEDIEKAYISLQKKIHPDEFVLHSDLARLAAASLSSRINRAYDHLKNPLMRAQFLLKRKGHWPISPAHHVLSEAMDLREEGLMSNNALSFQEKISALYGESYKSLSCAFSKEEWSRAGEEYLRLSYLGSILIKNKHLE